MKVSHCTAGVLNKILKAVGTLTLPYYALSRIGQVGFRGKFERVRQVGAAETSNKQCPYSSMGIPRANFHWASERRTRKIDFFDLGGVFSALLYRNA